MLTINNNIITMSRADTVEFSLFINSGTELEPQRYILTENDVVYFALMQPNQPFELATIKRIYTYESDKTLEGDLIITLNSSDTEFLSPGLYYYSLKMKTIDENDNTKYTVNTIVPNTKLYIID